MKIYLKHFMIYLFMVSVPILGMEVFFNAQSPQLAPFDMDSSTSPVRLVAAEELMATAETQAEKPNT